MVNGEEDMNFDILTPVMSGRDQGRTNVGQEEKMFDSQGNKREKRRTALMTETRLFAGG